MKKKVGNFGIYPILVFYLSENFYPKRESSIKVTVLKRIEIIHLKLISIINN
jgi:hypothetical protein